MTGAPRIDDARAHIAAALDALLIKGERMAVGESTWTPAPELELSVADELERIDAAVARRGTSFLAPIAAEIRVCVVELAAARAALAEEATAQVEDARTRLLVRLDECPPGLFRHDGVLGIKTEYRAMEVDEAGAEMPGHLVRFRTSRWPAAYNLAGEFFWGGVNTHEARAALLVEPVEVLD